MESQYTSLEAKVVILGEQGVGKTSIITSYIGNNFNRHVSPTIGASFFTCKINVSDYHVKLQIWDTAGQERFRAMAPMYYRNANAALIVFDITSYSSFEVMKTWVTELKKNVEEAIVLCIVGNKMDLTNTREIQSIDAEMYARSIGALYYETSAISKDGIEDAFLRTTVNIVQNVKSQNAQNEIDEGLCAEMETESISLHTHTKDNLSNDEGSYLFCC